MASPQTPVTPPNQVRINFSTRWTFQETFSIVRSAVKAIIFYAVAPCADHHSTRMAGRGVHPQQTGRNKQSIFFLSYYISNINSNKRSSPLASYSVHFFGFFSNWSSQVGAPLAPPTSCLKVRHMFDLQHQVPTKLGGGNQKWIDKV